VGNWSIRPFFLCCTLATVATNIVGSPAGPSREEQLRRDRREQTEVDREWRLKYEDDWKAYLKGANRAYRRWEIVSLNDRKAYQSDRRSRGLQPLPWRHMHR
jgi:hypothetical protein